MSEASHEQAKGKSKAEPASSRSSSFAAMTVWALATLLAAGAAWLLWKVYGRQLVAAPGELLLTMSRPQAIEPPYPVEDIGGQWGLLVLGELPQKYGRMTALLAAWWLGAALLFGLASRQVAVRGISVPGRLGFSLAGLGVFVAGLLLLQASFRAGANFERMAGVNAFDPFIAAKMLPLSLATKACFALALASVVLALVVGLRIFIDRRAGGGRSVVVDDDEDAFLPYRHRSLIWRLALVFAFACLAVPVIFSVATLLGPIPELLEVRLMDMQERDIVERMNGMLHGLRYSGMAVQLGGLLWVVAGLTGPGRRGKRKGS